MSTNSKSLEQGSLKPQFNSGKLVLYSFRLCPYAQRARLVLITKGIPHETVNILLRNKPDWFKALTPKAQVPAIELNDGKVLNESLVICDYLNSAYPGKELHSDDPYQRAVDQILAGRISDLASIIGSAVYKPKETDKQVFKEKLDQILEFYETKLGERDTTFFGGNEPMMVDYMLWPFFERFDAFLSLLTDTEMVRKLPPKLTKWTIAMLDDRAVQETSLPKDAHARYTKSIIDKTFDVNPDLLE